MRIAFVVERPTQFEAPFFRHAAADPEHRLRVLYTRPDPGAAPFDPELGRPVAWGIDLLGGYDWSACPAGALGLVRWLADEIAPARCDLAVVNGYTQTAYALAAVLARGARVPVALRLDSVLFAAPGPRERARRLLLAGVLDGVYDLFLGVGSLTLDYLRWCRVPEEKLGLLPYAVDVERFRVGARLAPAERADLRRRLGVPAGARAVLALAKLHPREAPRDLLRAASRLGEDVLLLVAGDGPERPELERFATEHLGDRARFLGYWPYADLPALYGAADLFVHPAREERWGVSVAEALAAGLPVVASSRVGAARDLIAQGANGFTYEVGDDADLAARIRSALALDRAAVAATSAGILSRWDYAAAWQSLLAAASRNARTRQGGLA